MGGAGNVWNNAAVYPLWVTMAVGAGVFGFRCAHWVLFDQDIQVTKSYRKADPADSDWLESQGKANYDHSLRRFLTARGYHGRSVHIFPEPSAIDPSDE